MYIILEKITSLTVHLFIAVQCGAGTQFNSTSRYCMPCPFGYYQNETGASSCSMCPDGKTTLAEMTQTVDDCIGECKCVSQPS